MNLQTLTEQLKTLRLTVAADELNEVLKHKGATKLDWVSDLFEREIDARKEKALQSRIKSARFPEITSLESFDWGFNPCIDQAKVTELATLKFIPQNQIALFLGPPGTRKTHFALSIGILATRQGYRVYCSSLKRLIKEITTHKAKNTLDYLFKKILSAHLWIIDDWGVVTMNRDASEEVFDLLDRRKHSSAMILTSNRAVEEWGQVFPDPVLANAAIDRMFDRAEVLTFEGKSYRMRGRIVLNEKA
jgi:DNA replication protein DnaC